MMEQNICRNFGSCAIIKDNDDNVYERMKESMTILHEFLNKMCKRFVERGMM